MSGTPREVLSTEDVSVYGVTEPVIVKLAKMLVMKDPPFPLDARELKSRLVQPS